VRSCQPTRSTRTTRAQTTPSRLHAFLRQPRNELLCELRKHGTLNGLQRNGAIRYWTPFASQINSSRSSTLWQTG
jgi:hypothetical protein